MIQKVNEVRPEALYMVDSFSTMYPSDVIHMRDSILEELNPDIMFGFHAHNNIQMSFANVQEFMNISTERTLFVDGSIYGMGRGGGNVPLELLLNYMNCKYGEKYDTIRILDLYQKYLEPIYKEYRWGYTLPYYLTATNFINSAWGWFFMNHGVDELSKLNQAFQMIPSDWTYTLNMQVGNEILEKIQEM
jgi:4-hydroxy 2-oxovalerate aldolase